MGLPEREDVVAGGNGIAVREKVARGDEKGSVEKI